MPRITFKIDDAFPADNDVARFITVLAMASNDANRSIDRMGHLFDTAPNDSESLAEMWMLFRQQAAFYYEAARFVAGAISKYPDTVGTFVAALPSEARDELAKITGGVDPKSPHYVGDWIDKHRNMTFHYSSSKIRPGLSAAVDVQSAIEINDDETHGSVRYWFADEVTKRLVPDEEAMKEHLPPLRESLTALIRFTQRAFVAYRATRPADTFTDHP